MSYASDPAYLKLVEESRAYRAQPNVKAANNAARVRNEGLKKNFFNRTGRYPTITELIDMSVEAEMANLVGVRQELNPNVAALLGTQDVQVHNYNANVARWKAGVASGSVNVAPKNFKGSRKAQNVNLNNRKHEPKSWAVSAQEEAAASKWLQSRRNALEGEKTNEELEWAAGYPARKSARSEANRAAYNYIVASLKNKLPPKEQYEQEKKEYARWLAAYNRDPITYTWWYGAPAEKFGDVPKPILFKDYYEKRLKRFASAAGEGPPNFLRQFSESELRGNYGPAHASSVKGKKWPVPGKTRKNRKSRKNRR